MTQRRDENTRVHFWTFSPVSVKAYEAIFLSAHVFQNNYSCANGGDFGNFSGKTPATATMKCKCPRTGSDNVRVCGWFSRRLSDQKPPLGLHFLYIWSKINFFLHFKLSPLVQQSAIDALTCLDPPTTTTTTTLSTTTAAASATTQAKDLQESLCYFRKFSFNPFPSFRKSKKNSKLTVSQT